MKLHGGADGFGSSGSRQSKLTYVGRVYSLRDKNKLKVSFNQLENDTPRYSQLFMHRRLPK